MSEPAVGVEMGSYTRAAMQDLYETCLLLYGCVKERVGGWDLRWCEVGWCSIPEKPPKISKCVMNNG